MSGLTYEQKETITRLRGAEMSPGDIAVRLGLDEDTVRSVLQRRKLRGFLGLAGIFGFFAAIIATPFFNAEHLEGEPVTDPAVMRANLVGEWAGTWLVRGHKRPMRLRGEEVSPGTWSLVVNHDDDVCAGDGDYSGTGTLSTDGLTARLVAKHPDCGELNIVYVMALDEKGHPQMKGRFLRMPNGDAGDHFLIRKMNSDN